MNSEKSLKSRKSSGYLVKTVWIVVILIIGSAISVAIAQGSRKPPPIVGMLMGLAILGVWRWKPESLNSNETKIQPLDKNDQYGQ